MVTVRMLTYNHEPYLRKAIESILMQEVDFEYEIIISDDASTDKTQEIIKGYKELYPDRVITILRKENLGPTRNGYDSRLMARGKYLACLEGDDFWIDKNKLKKQVDFLERHPRYIGCAHNYLRVDEEGIPVKMRYPSLKCYNRDFTMHDFLRGKANRLLQSATLVYKNIYKDTKTDFSIFYKAHRMIGDGTTLSLLLDRGDMYLFPDKMTAHRVKRKPDACNAVSIMSRNPLEYTKSVLKYANTLEDYFNNKYNFNFTRRIGIDFSSYKYRLLTSEEKEEFRNIIHGLPFSEKILFYLRILNRRLRYYVLYIPKKILKYR